MCDSYGIVSFSSYVWHLFLGEKLYLTSDRKADDAFFFEQKWGKTTFKHDLFPYLAVWWGFWNPEILDATKIPKKIVDGLDTTQKLARLEGDSHHVTVSISYSWFSDGPIPSRSAVFYHMKVGSTHRKKGKCCMDCFIEMSVQKPWWIILYRELYSVVQRFEDTGIMKYRVLKTQIGQARTKDAFQKPRAFQM